MLGFDVFSGYLGHILWILFDFTGNYGLAVIIFTFIVNILTLPIVIKTNHKMGSNEKFEAKKEELKNKFGNDPQKFNQECISLAQKEGVSPLKGSMLPMILTIIILSLIYSTVQKPLSSVLNFSKEKVLQSTSILTEDQKKQKGSDQLDLIRSFQDIKDKLSMFDEKELDKISRLSKGFNFLGVNLLNIPKYSPFNDMIWSLPVLGFFISAISRYVLQRTSGITIEAKGVAKYGVYLSSLFQAWIISRVFAVLGLYLIVNNIMATISSIIVDRFFSFHMVRAKKEWKRFNELVNDEN